MILEERIIRDIPVLIAYEPQSAPPPLLILSHGFTRSKEDWRDHLPELAARGYFAAALDNRGHGKRSGPDFHARANRRGKWNLMELRRLILETAEDIRTVVGDIAGKEFVDPGRIGLAGVSMGAFAALKALVSDERIRTAVSIIGSPYWDDLFEGTLEEDDPVLRQRLESFAAKHHPASFPDRFFPRAVLFQTGAKDVHLKSSRVRGFSRLLSVSYSSAREKIRYLEDADRGHEFTEEMWERALEWFERFL